MPEHLRDEWDKAKADAQAHREAVERTYDPAQWSDAQHDTFAELVNKAREKSKNGSRMTREEAEALKQYLKNPQIEYDRIKQDIANRREDATPDVRYDESTGSYYDRYGRECNEKGERY